MIDEVRQDLLKKYAVTSRAFSDAVERLTQVDGEAFIRGLDAAGTAHRASEQSRIKLHQHLTQRKRVI